MYLLFSTIVIRPSRMAIALGLMLFYLVLGLVLYSDWIHDMEIPDCSKDGLIIKIFYEVNPCYSVFRSFAMIYCFIQQKGSFTWSDIATKVPGDRWSKSPAGGYAINLLYSLD